MAKIHNVNIKAFAEKFHKEYDFLYEHNDNVAGYSEAVEDFDTRIKASENFKNFVGGFVDYRGDFISSDREAAAFMFTMESLGLLD